LKRVDLPTFGSQTIQRFIEIRLRQRNRLRKEYLKKHRAESRKHKDRRFAVAKGIVG
jgi:hypothetical protein